LAKDVHLERNANGDTIVVYKHHVGVADVVCRTFGLCLRIPREEWWNLPPEIREYAQVDGNKDEVRYKKLRRDIHAFRLLQLHVASERRLKLMFDIHNKQMAQMEMHHKAPSDGSIAQSTGNIPTVDRVSDRTRRFRMREERKNGLV
jgi:hypothetical protein